MMDGIALFLGLSTMVIIFLSLIDCFLGVLLIPQKKGYVREPAIFLLLSGLVAVYLNSSTFVARKGQEAFVAYGYLGLLIQLVQITAVVFLFLYAKKRYDSEGLAVVIILPIAWYFLHKVAQAALIRSSGLGVIQNQVFYSAFAALSNLVIIGVMIYIAVIFYRNKDREQVFKSIWIFPMLFAISYILNSVTNVMAVYTPAAMAVIIIKLVTAVVYPAFGIYLIVNLNGGVQDIKYGEVN